MSGDHEYTPFLSALGLVVIYANELEEALFRLHWEVSGRPVEDIVEEARGLTLGSFLSRVIRNYRDNIADADLVARLVAKEPELRAVVDVRNMHVHSSWSFQLRQGMTSLAFRTHRPRKGAHGHEDVKVLEAAEVQADAERIGAAAQWLLSELLEPTARHLASAKGQ